MRLDQLRRWRGLASFLAAFPALSACDASPSKPAGEQRAERPPLKGYGALNFGSSFTDAIASVGSDRFNPFGFNECLDDLPLKGCFLSPDTDAAPFVIEGGIPYMLMLDFNKYDRLTDIGLKYDREGEITREECLSIHERTLDWATRQFGPFWASAGKEPRITERTTPGSNKYLLGDVPGDNFVTAPMRTLSSPPSVTLQKKPITQWDNERYVSLLSHFIVVDGKPMCGVNLDFNEPQSVERRPPEQG